MLLMKEESFIRLLELQEATEQAHTGYYTAKSHKQRSILAHIYIELKKHTQMELIQL